jgi:hypothetical protein
VNRRAAAALALAVGLAATCAPTPKRSLVDGILSKEAYSEEPNPFYDRWVEVYDDDGLPWIPTASYNRSPVVLIQRSAFYAAFEDEAKFRTDTAFELEVEQYWGTARARINMPGDFALTRPEPDFVLGPGAGLDFAWQRSSGASWYWLVVLVQYSYTDTLGSSGSYRALLDTIVYDTMCRYAPDRFFPPGVGEVVQGDGAAVVLANDGPQTVAGARGNVEGQGIGYVRAYNQPEEIYFGVGPAPARELDRREPGRHARQLVRSRLRWMTGIPDQP